VARKDSKVVPARAYVRGWLGRNGARYSYRNNGIVIGGKKVKTLATHRTDAATAVYLPFQRQPLTASLVRDAFKFVNSPLTDQLRKRHDASIYAKAILHLLDVFESASPKVGTLSSQTKAWSVVAQRPGAAISVAIARLGLDG
jgi:hypothetical protein